MLSLVDENDLAEFMDQTEKETEAEVTPAVIISEQARSSLSFFITSRSTSPVTMRRTMTTKESKWETGFPRNMRNNNTNIDQEE